MNNRILILNRRYCSGEAWTNRVLAYAKGFAELGMDVKMCYLIGDKKHSHADINIPGVTVVNLWESDGWLARKFKIISFCKNILRFLKDVKLGDWVFQYGILDYQLWIADKLRSRAKLFCEVTEHPQYNSGSKIFSKKKRLRLLRSLDALFVISHQLKSLYIDYGLDEERVHIVNMFVDSTRFEGLKKTTNEKYIAYCGAVSYDKDGVNILVEAFSKFHQSHMDYKLRIIGKGVESDVIEKLKKMAKEKGVSDFVDFTGPISPTEMPQLLYNASILALARPNNLQAQHGFPTKLGEYFATGNPVVVTEVGEISRFVTNMENGILAKPDDAKDFAEKLSWVADHPKEAKHIGQKGKLLVRNEFSYLHQSKVLLEFLNK